MIPINQGGGGYPISEELRAIFPKQEGNIFAASAILPRSAKTVLYPSRSLRSAGFHGFIHYEFT
jgi:hypothetical protein